MKSGERVKVRIEGLAKGIERQVWMRQCTGREARCLLLSGFLQRARQSRGAALWPLAVAHRWREVAQCRQQRQK